MSICVCGGETKAVSSIQKSYHWIAESCKSCGRVSLDRLYLDGEQVASGVEARNIINQASAKAPK